ncbi:MAG: phasin family protein [Pseudoruegeria sp.]
MTNTQDFTKMMQDMMASFPVDTKAFEDAYKTTTELNEKFTNVALEAADKSAEISSKWTKDTIARLGSVSAAKTDVADYGKALTDFASASAETASENMAAFAEVAKKVQMETVELMMASGKNLSEDATAAVKKATTEATKATKTAVKAAAK